MFPLPRIEPLCLLLRSDLRIGRLIVLDKVVPESRKCTIQDRAPDLLHQPHDESHIMYRSETVCEKLLSLEQVMKIGSGECTAGIAVAISIDWPFLRLLGFMMSKVSRPHFAPLLEELLYLVRV